MKIYEYAKSRNIKSKDIVVKLHELGFTHVKNHLSLVPEKIIDKLDKIDFPQNKVITIRKSQNVLIISMECTPFFSKGLGEMVSNKIQFNNLYGNNVKVILPKHKLNSSDLIFCKDINVVVYDKQRGGKVYKYESKGIEYYFIENDYYFDRNDLYGFFDDAERFAFFAKASLEIIKFLDFKFDLINVHDWTLGLFPLMYKKAFDNEQKEAIIEFSVYGSTYQGIYGPEVLTDVFGLDEKYFEDKTVEYANSVNLLKAGLVTADKLDINKVALNDLKDSYLKQYIYDNM